MKKCVNYNSGDGSLQWLDEQLLQYEPVEELQKGEVYNISGQILVKRLSTHLTIHCLVSLCQGYRV